MKDKLSDFLSISTYFIFIGLFLLGIFHSFHRHSASDGVIGIVFFPWGMYRGLEFWWHDDHADVVWEKRLPSDMQTCIYFLSEATTEGANKFELNNNLEEFSNRVSKYPKDKREYLIKGVRKYIEFSNSVQTDLKTSLEEYLEGEKFQWITSSKTEKLEVELREYYLYKDIELLNRAFDEFKDRFVQDLAEMNDEIEKQRIEAMNTNYGLLKDLQQKEYLRTFENIFNEEL